MSQNLSPEQQMQAAMMNMQLLNMMRMQNNQVQNPPSSTNQALTPGAAAVAAAAAAASGSTNFPAMGQQIPNGNMTNMVVNPNIQVQRQMQQQQQQQQQMFQQQQMGMLRNQPQLQAQLQQLKQQQMLQAQQQGQNRTPSVRNSSQRKSKTPAGTPGPTPADFNPNLNTMSAQAGSNLGSNMSSSSNLNTSNITAANLAAANFAAANISSGNLSAANLAANMSAMMANSGVTNSGSNMNGAVPASGMAGNPMFNMPMGINMFSQGNGVTAVPPNNSTPSIVANPSPQSLPVGLPAANAPAKKALCDAAKLKVYEIVEALGENPKTNNTFEYWKGFVDEFFSNNGILRYTVKNGDDTRQFEFSMPIVPRFLLSLIVSGVSQMEVTVSGVKTHVLANSSVYVECTKTCWRHMYTDGSSVAINGTIKGILDPKLKIEWLDFHMRDFIPAVEWGSIERLISNQDEAVAIFNGIFEKKNDAVRKPANIDTITKLRYKYKVCKSLSNFGLQESVMRMLEVSESMAHLKNLMMYVKDTDTVQGPLQGIEQYVAQISQVNNAPAPLDLKSKVVKRRKSKKEEEAIEKKTRND